MLRRLLLPLRRRPLLNWGILLVVFVVWNVFWILSTQPTMGRPLAAWEIAYAIIGVLVLGVLLFAGWSEADLRAAGSTLAHSRWTGWLLTITTVVVLFFVGEWYLRLFYITTDAYGFTAMNYWWYQNYGLAQDNQYGYRDNEPLPDSPDLIRIAILGDSFAMGHGINVALIGYTLAPDAALDEIVAEKLHHLRDAAKALGCTLPEPFLQVAFLALPVIPHLKLTDRGLFDVDRFEFVA